MKAETKVDVMLESLKRISAMRSPIIKYGDNDSGGGKIDDAYLEGHDAGEAFAANEAADIADVALRWDVCKGIEIEPGEFSGCTGQVDDCPSCDKKESK